NDDHAEHTAHGGRPSFSGVGFGTFFADVLSDLEFAQLTDDRRTDDQPHKQRRQAGEGSAEGEIAEQAEGRKVRLQHLVQQPIEQTFSSVRCSTKRLLRSSTALRLWGEGLWRLRTSSLPAPPQA